MSKISELANAKSEIVTKFFQINSEKSVFAIFYGEDA